MNYVYAGNLPGRVGEWENTHCPECEMAVIERRGFRVTRNRLADGACPRCQKPIPGRWNPAVEGSSRTRGVPLPVL